MIKLELIGTNGCYNSIRKATRVPVKGHRGKELISVWKAREGFLDEDLGLPG